jgi:deoxyguanosine kinase
MKTALEPNFIAIEGAIGAGKTSLVNLLGEQLDAQVVLENDDENPFLPDFYRDKESFAFQTQIFFLLNRYAQYQDLTQRDLFRSMVITDFLFQRDPIFANLNLKEHELQLYNQIYNLIKLKTPKPDLVIYLQADTKVLQQRIEKRDRDYESYLDWEYLEKVNKAFTNFFFYYSETPLLVVNTTEIDFVEKKGDLEELISKINHHKIGREYYNPLGS